VRLSEEEESQIKSYAAIISESVAAMQSEADIDRTYRWRVL